VIKEVKEHHMVVIIQNQQESQVNQEHQAYMVHQEPQEHQEDQVNQAILDIPVCQDLPIYLMNQELELQEHKEELETQECQAIQVLQVLQVHLDILVPLVILDMHDKLQMSY